MNAHCAYSVVAYRRLMTRLVDAGWRFACFSDPPPASDRTVYLRHDVDYSLELAAELAKLNEQLGVRGTFCVQVRAQFYNVFSPVESDRIRRIRSSGQGVALHLEDDPTAELPDRVQRIRDDFELLRRIEPNLDPVFAWHRPTEAFLQRPPLEVPGLVNAYGTRFFREMPYLSDSTHRRSTAELEAAAAAMGAPAFQMLLHPINWMAGGSSGVEILLRGWTRVLRDHERTLLENRTYAAAFPNGMPPQLLQELERALLAAVASGE